jgi:xanthine dehydrogenase iron-sulfur cluster and FAD-binding subunit A
MTRRAAARRVDREVSGAIDFDAALELYLETGDAEDLLRAAGLVLGSMVPIDPERARAVEALTGTPYEIADYDDAAHAVRRWYAQIWEPGARH